MISHTYYSLYNISVTPLRFFTVYGPRQRPDLAIHKFTKKIINGESIPVYGDGSTQRDYTFIDDIVQGIMKAIDYNLSECRYEIFNLGESQTISLKEMISTLEQAIGTQAKKDVLPMQPGDVDRTFADISKSKKLLGYNPKTVFKEGIKIFIDWIRNNK